MSRAPQLPPRHRAGNLNRPADVDQKRFASVGRQPSEQGCEGWIAGDRLSLAIGLDRSSHSRLRADDELRWPRTIATCGKPSKLYNRPAAPSIVTSAGGFACRAAIEASVRI